METAKQKAQEYLDNTRKALQNIEVGSVVKLAERIKSSFESGGKVLIFGNGGSASDAQHMAAELVVRFEKNRKPFSAVALSTDTSVITAAGNDFGYDQVFSRQVEALAAKNDVVFAISTSGNSPNVLKAVESAKKIGCFTAGLTGESGGALKKNVDLCITAGSNKTADIQVCHIALIHILCFLLESIYCE